MAKREPNVGDERFDGLRPAGLSPLLLNEREVSEFTAGRCHGLVRRPAAGDELLRATLEMELHLVVHLAF